MRINHDTSKVKGKTRANNKGYNKFCRKKRNFEPVTHSEICVQFRRIINYCLVMASQSQRNLEFFGESEKEQMIERT